MFWLAFLSQLAPGITVDVGGLPSSRGVVECVLWTDVDGFPRDTSRGRIKVSVPVVDGHATCVFDNVEPGTFAVTLMHDENGNGTMDTGVFGIPTERYGFSNNPRPFLRAPTFKEAAFVVGNTPVRLDVKVL